MIAFDIEEIVANKRAKTIYTTEFEERAIRIVISSEKATSQTVKDLGVKTTTLYACTNKTNSPSVEETGQSSEQKFDALKRL